MRIMLNYNDERHLHMAYGICHKINMPMEFYQVHRNSLIIQATSGVTPEVDYLKRIKDIFDREISRYNYVGCDLLLDAVDEFSERSGVSHEAGRRNNYETADFKGKTIG